MVFLRALLLLALIFEAQSCQTTTCTGPGCQGHDPNGLGGRMSIRRPSMVRIERLAFMVCDEDRDFGLSWEEVASCEVRMNFMFLSTSIYDLVLIYVCHFHHHQCNGCSTLALSRYSCVYFGSLHPRNFLLFELSEAKNNSYLPHSCLFIFAREVRIMAENTIC